MADSLSEKVLIRIRELLAGIAVGGGYETNIGQRTHRARSQFDPSELPCVAIWDGGEEPLTDKGGVTNNGSRVAMLMRQTIVVQAHVRAEQDDTGELLGKAKADVKKRLCSGAPEGHFTDSNGNKIGAFAYVGSRPAPREDGSVSESVEVTFQVTYPEKYGNPYA